VASGTPHSDETRAAVLAALLEGQSINHVAETFHLDRKTVRDWGRLAGVTSPHVPQQQAAEIGDLVIRHVRSALLALEAQARVASDPAWLASQPASDLAVLYGIMADKAHRILAALEPLGPDAPADLPDP
jgi:hypothetical protein